MGVARWREYLPCLPGVVRRCFSYLLNEVNSSPHEHMPVPWHSPAGTWRRVVRFLGSRAHGGRLPSWARTWRCISTGRSLNEMPIRRAFLDRWVLASLGGRVVGLLGAERQRLGTVSRWNSLGNSIGWSMRLPCSSQGQVPLSYGAVIMSTISARGVLRVGDGWRWGVPVHERFGGSTATLVGGACFGLDQPVIESPNGRSHFGGAVGGAFTSFTLFTVLGDRVNRVNGVKGVGGLEVVPGAVGVE